MIKSDKYEPPKPRMTDKARDLVLKSAALFGPAGLIASEVLGYLIKPPYEKRLHRWREQVGDA